MLDALLFVGVHERFTGDGGPPPPPPTSGVGVMDILWLFGFAEEMGGAATGPPPTGGLGALMADIRIVPDSGLPTLVFYRGNDCLLELRGLRNEAGTGYVNDAIVTITLRDITGATVSGQTWPLTMVYLSGSNGVYQALLQDSLAASDYQRYTAIISVSGSQLQALWSVPLVCLPRTH